MRQSRFTAQLIALDVLAAVAAYVAAFVLRFHSGLISVERGLPPFEVRERSRS